MKCRCKNRGGRKVAGREVPCEHCIVQAPEDEFGVEEVVTSIVVANAVGGLFGSCCDVPETFNTFDTGD